MLFYVKNIYRQLFLKIAHVITKCKRRKLLLLTVVTVTVFFFSPPALGFLGMRHLCRCSNSVEAVVNFVLPLNREKQKIRHMFSM